VRCEQRGDGGSALLLVPVGILIVVLLGSLVVDSAVVFLAEREAESAASAAANDLAALALDEEALRTEGRYVISDDRLDTLVGVVEDTVIERLSAAFVEGSVVVAIRVIGPTQLEVRVSGEARRVVGPFGWATSSPEVSAVAVGTVTITG
jgi:hypothetical protein